jgi:hypothetical protein
MTTRNGTAARIVAYVAAHPGCTRAKLLSGCGITEIRSAMPTYCCKAGLIHAAGPRGSQRYYPCAAQAAEAHANIVASVQAHTLAKKRMNWVRDNLRKRAQRHSNGGRARNTRPGQHVVRLDPGTRLSPDVRIVIAPPMKGRWA